MAAVAGVAGLSALLTWPTAHLTEADSHWHSSIQCICLEASTEDGDANSGARKGRVGDDSVTSTFADVSGMPAWLKGLRSVHSAVGRV